MDVTRSGSAGPSSPDRRPIWLRSTAVITVGSVLMIAAGEMISPRPGALWRGDIFSVLTLVAAAPAGAASFGIRSAVLTVSAPTDNEAARVVGAS